MGKLKMAAVVATGILFMVLACVFGVQGSRNKAIDLEQAVEMAESDIHVQENGGLICFQIWRMRSCSMTDMRRKFCRGLLTAAVVREILRMHTLPFQRLQKHTRS